MGGPEAGGVPELGVEEGGVVVGDQRGRSAIRVTTEATTRPSGPGKWARSRSRMIGMTRVDLMDDVLGLDIDDPSQRIGVLEFRR